MSLPGESFFAASTTSSPNNFIRSSDVSRLEISGEGFMSRVQGGMLADSIMATIAGLATVPPLTTFSQNSGVIALTRNASRSSGYMCAFILFLMGIIGKFGAIFCAAPALSLAVSPPSCLVLSLPLVSESWLTASGLEETDLLLLLVSPSVWRACACPSGSATFLLTPVPMVGLFLLFPHFEY